MAGSRRSARAIAIRCRCPPESLSAPLPEHRVEPERHRVDEPERVRPFGCRPDVGLRDVVEPVGDVVPDRLVEEERVLVHDGDQAPEVGLPDVADVVAVDEHAAPLGIVEADEEIGERGFPRPGGPHDRYRLAPPHD